MEIAPDHTFGMPTLPDEYGESQSKETPPVTSACTCFCVLNYIHRDGDIVASVLSDWSVLRQAPVVLSTRQCQATTCGTESHIVARSMPCETP